MPARCVNLDWLEVHAREPIGMSLDCYFFQNLGYTVDIRDYGTRVYREMFTILAPNGCGLLEIRRNPASQGVTGIHDSNECHIRLCNRSCYFDNAALFLYNFLEKHGYYNVRISRVDICLDFIQFDKGDDPAAFVRRYFRHKYAKINQGRISSHGEDNWSGQDWNSLSWGSKSSSVTTKLYNKTLELYDKKTNRYGKPYIREAWFRCGLIDNIAECTKDGEKVDVWRVEFSLKSSVKNWVPINLNGQTKKIQSLRNDLQVYSSREKILIMFASLARHYFHFKIYEDGKRKDRCEDKVLFEFKPTESVYKIGKPETALGEGKNKLDKFNRLKEEIMHYQQVHFDVRIKEACSILIAAIAEENMRADLDEPWSREKIEFYKNLINMRANHKDWTYETVLNEVKRIMNITDRVISEF